MKRIILAVAVCFAFSTYVPAMSPDEEINNGRLRRLIEDDVKDTQEVIRNSIVEAHKSIVKARESYIKAQLKDVQSYKVYVTKADVLKTYDIEANKARGQVYKLICQKFGIDNPYSESNNSSHQNGDMLYSECDVVNASAAKMYAILREAETETIKSNSSEAIKLYDKAAKFYDKAVKAYGEIVIACSSTNTAIIRIAEKVKGTEGYAKYEAHIAEKRRTAELWTKEQSYAKKLKEISEAYARVAAVYIELHEAAKTYAKAAKTYAKAAKTYAKAAKRRSELPEADSLCFEFEDAVALHKAHKISDVQLAIATSAKASWETKNAYAAYCRTNLKLMEAIVAACCEEDEAAKIRTELNKSSIEQAQDNVQRQAECISCY
jgi:tetratricopeptide (TPR) repeat protein